MADVKQEVAAQLADLRNEVDTAQAQVTHLRTVVDGATRSLESAREHAKAVLAKLMTQLREVESAAEGAWREASEEVRGVGSHAQETAQALERKVDDTHQHIEASRSTVESLVTALQSELASVGEERTIIESFVEQCEGVVRQSCADAAQHLADSEPVFVENVDRAATAIRTGVSEAADTLQSDFESLLAELEETDTRVQGAIDEHVSSFGEHLATTGSDVHDRVEGLVQSFNDKVLGGAEQMVETAERLDTSLRKMSEAVEAITVGTVETIDVLSDGMESTNVGLNVVVDTVQGIKEILDELSL